MNSAPLITAIIPTYKRPRLLKRAVRSFLRQTFIHFEVLIADNSSGKETDDAMNELMRQDNRVKVLQHDTNIGLTATFQSALMHVKTPYVCFLCDDDFVTPYFFEEVLPIFSAYPDIAFCGGGALLMDQNYHFRGLQSQGQTILPSGYYPAPSGFFAYLHSSFGLGLSSLLIKTDVLKKVGGFDSRIRNGTDEDPISKCSARYPIYLLTERPFFFAYHHASNLSSQINFPLYERECLALHENLASVPFSVEERMEIDRFFFKRKIKILSSAFNYYCSKKEFDEAKIYAKKLEVLTSMLKWKRKRLEVSVMRYFPYFFDWLMRFKNLEKNIRHRCLGKKSPTLPQINRSFDCDPQDALKWKNYVLDIEKEA